MRINYNDPDARKLYIKGPLTLEEIQYRIRSYEIMSRGLSPDWVVFTKENGKLEHKNPIAYMGV